MEAPARLRLATPGQRFELGNQAVEVIFNPGHTLGAVSYYVRSDAGGAVFTGDTMFGAGCGRRFEGTADVFHASLMSLAALPPATLVYFGHEYTASNLRFAMAVEPTHVALAARAQAAQATRDADAWTTPSNVALEVATNPFLRCAEPALQAAVAAHAKAAGIPHPTTPPSPAETFAALRAWKDAF